MKTPLGMNIYNEVNKLKYSFCKAIEFIYYLRNTKLVLPISFGDNIIQSSISGSINIIVAHSLLVSKFFVGTRIFRSLLHWHYPDTELGQPCLELAQEYLLCIVQLE